MLKKFLIICLFLNSLGNYVFAADEVLSDCKSDNLKSKREVNSFDDIGRYLSRKKVRHVYASSGSPCCGESPKIRYECIGNVQKYYNRLGNVIDSLDLIDYSCDTVCIRMSGNPAAPYADPIVRLYCKKGLYKINDFTLTPIIYPEEYCGEKRRAQDEEMRKKYEPDLDAWPMSYDWEMMLYQCYDEDKLYKNHGGSVAEFYMDLTRVIIQDNRIVYCDCWIW